MNDVDIEQLIIIALQQVRINLAAQLAAAHNCERPGLASESPGDSAAQRCTVAGASA